MAKKAASRSLLQLTQRALLIALIVLATYFPFKIFVDVTVCFLPVVFGAILLGPQTGALLGLIWGACSFAQCFGWFSPSPLGAAVVAVDPWLALVMCVVPRILAGWLSGWIYRGLRKTRMQDWACCGVAGLCIALLNTVFFVSALLLFFYHSEYIQNFRQAFPTFVGFLIACFGANCAVEAAIGLVTGMAYANILPMLRRR